MVKNVSMPQECRNGFSLFDNFSLTWNGMSFIVCHMNPTKHFKTMNRAISSLLLEMAQINFVNTLFQTIVRRLTEFPSIALARIWLVRPADICSECYMADECNDRERCLHLVASSGRSSVDPNEGWNNINGRHRRFAIGPRKVGYIAANGSPVLVKNIKEDSMWIAYPDWAAKEGIYGFAGQPLIFRGKVLGVLAIFSQFILDDEFLNCLRMIADHAATAIANASAFDAIERLKQKLEAENAYLRQELFDVASVGGIVGKSYHLQRVLNQVEMVAPTNATVLVSGESGVGKELVAREIHQRSIRKEQPLIKVNCASIPKDLFGSEFFGHTKGAFTGAVSLREGRFAAADGGTLFLDEIGEIPLDLQCKLLRVLQEGEFERIGDDKTMKVNVRIIAATNRNLEKEVAAGRFREDLFFRLNVFPIKLPPLRERKADIAPLADHFLKRCRKNMNRPQLKLTFGHIQLLESYDWPGNCRELQNIIERAAIVSQSGKLKLELPFSAQVEGKESKEPVGNSQNKILTEKEMLALQRKNTLKALQQCHWKVYGEDGAAELLGLKPTTLNTRIKKMNLQK